MKVLFDSNVLISAFTTQGVSQRAFRLCLEHHEMYVSEYILEEIGSKLTKKFGFTKDEANEIIGYLRKVAILVDPSGEPRIRTRDPKDDAILYAATEVSTDVLVTGDKDLLDIETADGIIIMNPRAFLELHTTG